MHLKKLLLIISFLFLFSNLNIVFARITPEDIVNSQMQSYNSQVAKYSNTDRQKLEKLSSEIAQINKQRTTELENIMLVEGNILDEFQRRNKDRTNPAIDNARYWITYAHEAVAYQAAKIYIFNLTSESNLKNDSLNLIGLFESDLNSTRLKVLNSQKILAGVIK